MVVEVGEQFPVGNHLLIEPGALLWGQVLEDLLSHNALGLTHTSRIPIPGDTDLMWEHSGCWSRLVAQQPIPSEIADSASQLG
jgi:hypothetical protein